eukprot:3749118-Lingulodinium_polyedra.AAC.1
MSVDRSNACWRSGILPRSASTRPASRGMPTRCATSSRWSSTSAAKAPLRSPRSLRAAANESWARW